jgi:hypothetical protein
VVRMCGCEAGRGADWPPLQSELSDNRKEAAAVLSVRDSEPRRKESLCSSLLSNSTRVALASAGEEVAVEHLGDFDAE